MTATYYSFSPRMVAEYVPAIWSTADPVKVLDARLSGVDRALRALLGDRVDSPELAEAAALARRAAEAADLAGRPVATANAELPWPDAPHLALWQAATVLREHRGDGHVATLITAGLDPTEALVSFAAVGAAPVEVFASRRWTDEEWAAARERLAGRGLVDAAGVATEAGHRLRDEVERRTDELAAAPWRALGPAVGRFAQLVAPLTGRWWRPGCCRGRARWASGAAERRRPDCAPPPPPEPVVGLRRPGFGPGVNRAALPRRTTRRQEISGRWEMR